jgi:anti-sigma regulatory factor (Ser/Thr protein kinase)
VRETTALLTDEIVANAVQHAHHIIELGVTDRTDNVLVEALASSWGVRPVTTGPGKIVWFTADR